MTTTPADHAHALCIIQGTGATLEQANDVLARFYANGIHLVRIEPPVEPYTGEKAAEPSARVAELKRIVRAVTKPTEYEEHQG